MKKYQRSLLTLLVLAFAGLALSELSTAQKQNKNHPYDSGKPMLEPILFAEGVINVDGEEYGPTFTPDGKTIYFAKRIDNRKKEHIFVSRFENGKWTMPAIASFSGQYFDKEPFIAPDGKRLFFASQRPVNATSNKKDFNIWFVEVSKTDWGTPQNPGSMVNSDGYDNYPAVSASGTLYFGSVREGGYGEGDLYRARMVDGKYTKAENLGAIINTSHNEADPYIAPDESYLIFSANDYSDNLGEGDLYISFNKKGTWTQPVNLGPKINSPDYEYTPLVSPNGKYLFFSRGWGKIYQIDSSVLNLKR